MKNSILLVDDDGVFRALMCRLLRSQGFDVQEARSGREADNILANSESPVLTIVDYRLPEVDGISWITRLRESGHKFPIVFLSSTWCDEKTFSRLRNLLKVSLILRKPIDSMLFLQQLENLLPVKTASAPMEFVDQSPEVQETESSEESTDALPEPTRKLRTKLERKQLLATVQEQLRHDLIGTWKTFVLAVNAARENIEDIEAKNEAINQAHKISGTAGSIGLPAVSQVAGRIEDLLMQLDPEGTLLEIQWSEIFRYLADGETTMREAAENTEETGAPVANRVKFLLFGKEERYAKLIEQLRTTIPVNIEICESLADAVGTLGKLLHVHFRAEDKRGKIGEDAFALTLPGIDQATAESCLQKLRDEYSDLRLPRGSTGHFKAKFSFGVAQYPTDGTTVSSLLNAANRRLISGRNTSIGAFKA